MQISTHAADALQSYSTHVKAERLEARVSAEQKLLFQHAANILGWSLTDFVLSSLQQTAKQVIQEHHTLLLSAEDSRRFVQRLLKPTPPNPYFKKALKRYQQEVR